MGELSVEAAIQKINEAEEQISRRIAENMKTFGVSSTVGRLLGIIYMNKESMTLDDLAENTGMSKTRMSQVVREMISLNIAEREFIKGKRKEFYNVEQDYIQTFISLFTTNWQEVISRNRTFEQKLKKEIQHIEENSENTKELNEKIQQLYKELEDWSSYYNWIARLVTFFESGEIFKYVPIQAQTKGREQHE